LLILGKELVGLSYDRLDRTLMDILLVDDNADYLRLLGDALILRGYTVHAAEDGLEGCEILNDTNIHLIISDIRMPRFNGLKLHEFARKMERYRQTKFIFISAYEKLYRDAMNLDPTLDFFLDKLTSTDEIIEFVDKKMFGDFTDTWH
jgi:CheY-like chemotaxis protein